MARTEEMPKRMPTPQLPQPGDDRAQQVDPQSMPGLPAPPDERSGGGDVGQKLDALTQEVRRLAAALEGRQTPDAGGTPNLPAPRDDRKATGAPKEVRTDDMSARQMLSLILSRVAQIADQRPQGML